MMARKAAPRDEVYEALAEFGNNVRWAYKHPEKFRRHRGRFVVVQRKRIVAVSDDEEALWSRYGQRYGVFIRYVPPPDLVWII